MSAAKTIAVGLVIWSALGTLAQADPLYVPESWQLYPLGSSPPASDSNPPADSGPTMSTFSASNASPASPPAPAPSSSSGGPADAFINFGSGSFLNADTLTTGGAQAWYNSPNITNLFGGQPNSQQQSDFANTVLQRVEQTFSQSGVPVNLTDDPNVHAAHTLSLVSNTSGTMSGGVIGLTYLGGNGFSFIDQIGKTAQSVDQLASIVAHNISHELMLAFGVGENYDTSGNYIDARNANFSMMVSPDAKFSPAAADALRAADLQKNVFDNSPGAQLIEAQTIPEPTTIALWGLAAAAAAFHQRRRIARRTTR